MKRLCPDGYGEERIEMRQSVAYYCYRASA